MKVNIVHPSNLSFNLLTILKRQIVDNLQFLGCWDPKIYMDPYIQLTYIVHIYIKAYLNLSIRSFHPKFAILPMNQHSQNRKQMLHHKSEHENPICIPNTCFHTLYFKVTKKLFMSHMFSFMKLSLDRLIQSPYLGCMEVHPIVLLGTLLI